jgi:predicted glycoside hydrolase/deacetylase ChbG (UPF0249 family)
MAKEVIFVADDLGMTPEINDAIIHAHNLGALTAAALMMAQPGTEQAIALARKNPFLRIGWHLHLNDSLPATVERWPWGKSPAAAGVAIGLSRRARELMRREVAAQWELFRRTGLDCAFINSHHHLHTHPFVHRALLETVGPEFHGWIRLGQARTLRRKQPPLAWRLFDALLIARPRKSSAWPSPDTLWGVDRSFQMDANEVRANLAALPDGLHEFLFHPRTRSSADTLCLLELRESPSA